MSVEPVFKASIPISRPHAPSRDEDLPRRTTNTVAALFPARSRPRNVRQSSQNSVHTLGRRSMGQASLRNNSISSGHKSHSSEDSTPPTSAETSRTNTLEPVPDHESPGPSHNAPPPPAKDPMPPRPRPRASEPQLPRLNEPIASDVWRIQCKSEQRRNEQLKDKLAAAQEICRSQREIIENLQRELDVLKTAHSQCHLDARSAITESTNTRKHRLQMRMQMIREDFREHRVLQRIRQHGQKRGKSEDGRSAKGGSRPSMPKRVLLSSSMG